ncbi:MAG: DUF4142 domain-containing protein [Gammaproteobacteria bacterium]|nr:MAG: DUF4142 domain-containing protein [Gammaproteobacteria bacterium]
MNIPEKFLQKILTKVLGGIFNFAYPGNRIDDEEFINLVIVRCALEIKSSQLILQNLTRNTRLIAQQLIEDYVKIRLEICRIAVAKKISVLNYTETITDGQARELMDNDRILSDTDYGKTQVLAHEDMITLFKRASTSEDPVISKYIQKTLPTLHYGLKISKKIR